MKLFTKYRVVDKLSGGLASLLQNFGLNRNKLINKLLGQTLPMDDLLEKRRDLSGVAGKWDQSQLYEFRSTQTVFTKIDEGLWH